VDCLFFGVGLDQDTVYSKSTSLQTWLVGKIKYFTARWSFFTARLIYFTALWSYFTARWSYLTARWSLEQAVKWYFTPRQSRENGHLKKK
jgi:hypothetical protein